MTDDELRAAGEAGKARRQAFWRAVEPIFQRQLDMLDRSSGLVGESGPAQVHVLRRHDAFSVNKLAAAGSEVGLPDVIPLPADWFGGAADVQLCFSKNDYNELFVELLGAPAEVHCDFTKNDGTSVLIVLGPGACSRVPFKPQELLSIHLL